MERISEGKTLQLDVLALSPDKASFWSCLKSMNDTFIRNELIKASLESLMPIYVKLFNLILQSGKMPDI